MPWHGRAPCFGTVAPHIGTPTVNNDSSIESDKPTQIGVIVTVNTILHASYKDLIVLGYTIAALHKCLILSCYQPCAPEQSTCPAPTFPPSVRDTCNLIPPRRAPVANNNTDIAAILAQLVTQLTQANGATNSNHGANGNGGANPSQCTFKHFNSCNPLKFYGTEGATGLLQWFESIENTFHNSDCPDNLRVRHATSVLQKRALTWWNGEKRTRGVEVAMALPWDEVKRLMTEEFCPRNEVKKLEAEFWDLAQDGGESLAYTTRFHELSLLVSHMVTPLSCCIEKYISGLPRQIQDTVLGINPATLENAIRLSAILTDNYVKAGTLTRKGTKKKG
ncbi:hypothetical protein L1987_30339 [Smallanthus sonchifolius]|uniref:Uncharacterized protein n=1 Tax=Smallanthus sonchifolius TaxID=185202 RepID=A0ACB9I1X9_9ASTR|nr:hypothetical protein L1987_30339 [Smallanthus sonchifolius]